jgi:hypothetical protein
MKKSLVAFFCLALGVLKLQAALLVDDGENAALVFLSGFFAAYRFTSSLP